MKDKGNISSKILRTMKGLEDIFKDRKTVLRGLTSNETISIFFGIPMDKVLSMNEKTKRSKWHQIRTAKIYLRKREVMGIIFKDLPKGTKVHCPEFGTRVLTRLTKIFYRCSELEEAMFYRKQMDKIGKGVTESGDQVVEIVEGETENREILATINGQKNKTKN